MGVGDEKTETGGRTYSVPTTGVVGSDQGSYGESGSRVESEGDG